MNLFEFLFKKGAESVVSNVMDKVAESIDGIPESHSASNQTIPNKVPQKVPDRIEMVVKNHFPSYTLKANINASVFGGDSQARTISYVMYEYDEPKLGIMVLSGSNDYRKNDVRLAHSACTDSGFKCINIMTYLPSTYEYIKDVISNNL